MIQKIKRPVSILLALLMVVGMFAALPFTASAAEDTITVFFTDDAGWGNVNVYGWNGTDGATTAAWPGKSMNNLYTNSLSQNVYGATIPASTTSIKFNYNGIETNEITLVVDGGWWKTGGNGWVGETKHAATSATETTPGNIKYYELDGRYYNDSLSAISAEQTVIPATGPAVTYVAQIGNTKYETLADAFAAAVDGDTITLLANCAGNGIKVTPAGKFANGLTVDFAGFTYTVDGETVGSTGTETNGFQLLKDNKVTFKNGTITSAKAKILVQNYSDLTLDNMTLTLNNPNYTGAYTLSDNNGEVVIKDTTINANPAGGYAFDVCRFSSYPSVNVTVTGNSKINGNVEISASNGQAKDGFSLTLESGEMTGNIVVDASAQALVGDSNKVTKADGFSQEAPADFKWVDNGDGTSTLVAKEYVAEVVSGNNVGTKYETVNEAVAAAGENGEVKLIADINIEAGELNVGIDGDYTTTLDLNGQTITNAAGSGITLYTKYPGGKTFTIKDTSAGQTGAITITKKYPGDGCISDSSGRKVVIEGGTYTNVSADGNALYISSDEGWTINGGTFNGGIKVVSALDVTGGTINGNINATGPSWTVAPAEVTISGGTVNGSLNSTNGSTFAVSGGTFSEPVPAAFCADGYDPVDNGNGTYGVTPHTHAYTTPSFNWTQDAAGDWTCDKLTLTCSCGATQEYDATGFFGASAVTVTADANGDFTYTISKKVDGVTYSDTKTLDANGVIKSDKQLKAAGKVGRAWELGADINGAVDVQCANGFVLDGNNHTVTRHANVATQAVFRTTTANAVITLKNLTIDGIAGQSDSKSAVASTQTGNNTGNTINLENVSIVNYDIAQNNIGAVLAWGHATVNMKDCTIVTDSSYDVWGGAASTVNVDGGNVGKIYLNGGTASVTVENATVTNNINARNGNKIKEDDYSNVTIPADSKLVDNDEGGKTVVPKEYVAQVNDGAKYETLEEAFAAAVDGDTITLLADCAGNGIKVTPAGKFNTNGLTVNFDGHTYTVDGDTVGSTGTETNGFQLLKNNKVTFENGTITSTKAKILVQNYSDLTLDKMTLTLNNPNYTSAYTLSDNNGNVVINDTTINANPAGGFAFDVCRYSSYPSVHVTVTGNSVINGDVEIFASKGDAKQGFSLTLESGTMTGNIVVDATAKALVGEDNKVTKANTFTQTAPADFRWVDNGDGTSTLAPIPYVAKIGDAKYETLADAFAAAVDGDTITLLANCAGNGIKVTPAGKFNTNGLTVDFAGFTYTVDGETVGSTGTETNGFQLLKNNKVTFKNGTITSAKAKILVQNYSDLTLDGMTLTLNNPNYTGAYTLSDNNGEVVIKDTTINANPAGGFAFDVCRFSSYPSVHVTVKGDSLIKGDVEISASNGQAKDGFSLTLESGEMTGNIVVDASAKALVGENNKVTKADTFTQTAPEGFIWKDNGDNTSTLVPAKLFNGYSISTDGDIHLNFFIDKDAIPNFDTASSVVVKFTWDSGTEEGGIDDFSEVNLKTAVIQDGYLKAKCTVNAAQMACPITATVYVGETAIGSDTYSVKLYADKMLKDPDMAPWHDFLKAMLNYGGYAQTVFAGETDAEVPNAGENVTIDMSGIDSTTIRNAIQGGTGATIDDLRNIGEQIGGEWYTTSVIFLSKNTIRHYFDDVNETGMFNDNPEMGTTSSDWIRYVEKSGIAPDELDTLYEFTVEGETFKYSVLNYAADILQYNTNTDAQNLAKALYLYNQAANTLFAQG